MGPFTNYFGTTRLEGCCVDRLSRHDLSGLSPFPMDFVRKKETNGLCPTREGELAEMLDEHDIAIHLVHL